MTESEPWEAMRSMLDVLSRRRGILARLVRYWDFGPTDGLEIISVCFAIGIAAWLFPPAFSPLDPPAFRAIRALGLSDAAWGAGLLSLALVQGAAWALRARPGRKTAAFALLLLWTFVAASIACSTWHSFGVPVYTTIAVMELLLYIKL